MSIITWSIDDLRKYIKLSEDVYSRAKKLEEEKGKRIYEGLMSTLDLKGSSEAGGKFLEIQYRAAIPLVVLDENDTWSINKDVLTVLIKTIDGKAPVEKIIRETEPDPSKHAGRVRLKLGGAWGEIIAFYILNDPLPKMVNILYLLHMATYVLTFTTVTIPEIYTGSEEFLKLIEGVDNKRGALEFLTKLLRRRYIPEDQYAEALEAVNHRRELPFMNLREELERYESRVFMAEQLVSGVSGIIARLQEVLQSHRDEPIPREKIASIVGDVFTVTRGLEKALEEYRTILTKLNDLLTTSGKTINPDKVRQVIEELARSI